MMILLISVLFVALLLVSYLAADLHRANKRLYEELEQTELDLSAEKRAHTETQQKLHLVVNKPEPTPLTAGEIAARAVRRLRLRRSASDEVAALEEANRTEERKHLTIKRNIETYGLKDLAMKEKL